MSVDLLPATYADVVFIARRLRKADAEEIFPLLFHATPESLAAMSVAGGGIASVAFKDGVPVAAWGVGEQRPRCWRAWMFATDEWPKVALSVTRHIMRVIRPALIDAGAVRLDCWTMESHGEAHRWLESLGAVREATVEDYAATRSVYHCYSWTRSRLERNDVCRPVCPQNAEFSGTTATAAGPGTAAAAGRPGGQRRGRRRKASPSAGQRQGVDDHCRPSG